MSDLGAALALGPVAGLLVDPNSTLGLRLEGVRARSRGREAVANPYTVSHPGSLAQLHWWEGWFLEGQRLAGLAKPDVAAAEAFAKEARAKPPSPTPSGEGE